MKILLSGSNGQLGTELRRQLSRVGEVAALPRSSLDITDYVATENIVHRVCPDVIVNAAAYTAVDQAEHEKELAFAINAEAVKNLAGLAARHGAWFIHYSTDYVFDGLKPTPYVETDATSPINVYGASKLAGEQAIEQSNCQHLIFRTTWVVGKDGHNFAKTILRLAAERAQLSVISDQHGVPTSPSLIARVTTEAIQAIKTNSAWPKGIYHLVPEGASSWYEIAQNLLDYAAESGVSLRTQAKDIQAITTADYAMTARRPLNSLLDTQKLHTQLSFDVPGWKDDFLGVARALIKEMQSA